MSRTPNDDEAQPSRPNGTTLRDYQELWFALAKREWTSVVLVPVDPDGSAAQVGKSLAEVGTKLSELPVTSMSVSSLQYESAFVLADLQQHVQRERRGTIDPSPIINVTPTPVADAPAGEVHRPRPAKPTAKSSGALALAATQRLIIAIPPIVTEPLGLAATQAADAIVLMIEIGRTRIADAKRTIEMIGRDRIAGCLLVR